MMLDKTSIRIDLFVIPKYSEKIFVNKQIKIEISHWYLAIIKLLKLWNFAA